MSRPKLTQFLKKLKTELRKNAKFRAETGDVAQNTFYYSPKELQEALKTEFEFRKIEHLIAPGTELNAWIKRQTERLLTHLRGKYKNEFKDRKYEMKGNQHFMMVTLQSEINPKSKAGNPYNNFVSLRKLYKEGMDKFAVALAQKCSDLGEKLLQTKNENEEFKKTGKFNPANNKRVVGTKEVELGSHLVEGGHDKGYEIYESKLQKSLASAFNDEYPRRVSRKVLNADLKKLGLDVSMERDDTTGEYYFRMQSLVDNRAGGTISAKASQDFNKQLEEALIKLDGDNQSILKLQGSPSMLDMKMDDTAITLLKPFEGKKNIKVTKPKKPKKTKKKPIKNKAKVKAKKSPMSITAVAVRKINLSKAKSQRRKKGGGGTSFNPLQIVALINKELPDTVEKNMGEPRLVSRSGRFASSVRATDVVKTPQGFPSVGYTYQRNPYQIFEDGMGKEPWANGQRDPRQLIDQSIREIAVRFALGRLYTRRL